MPLWAVFADFLVKQAHSGGFQPRRLELNGNGARARLSRFNSGCEDKNLFML
jgi:hypothetical protein